MSTAVVKTMETPILSAISIGPQVRDWLDNTRAPRILNIYQSACNLVNEHREVISLVNREVGNGPFNLLIFPQSSVSIFDQINSCTPISIRWPGLKIGDIFIDVRLAILWNAQPDWSGLAKKKRLIVSNLLSNMKWLSTQAHPDSLLSLTRAAHIPGYRSENFTQHLKMHPLEISQTLSIFAGWMNSIFEAVHSVDLDKCRLISQHLAGLGLGLTPAGDDFLLGVIYAAWIIHPQEKAALIAARIASAAIPHTNSLSAAWIQAAARGLVNEIWFDFLAIIRMDGHNSIEASLRRLLSVGHTSGADALAGFIGCLTQDMAQLDLKLHPAHQNEFELMDTNLAVPLWD